jgi:pyruvate-formate lyase-activating enzyme
MLDNVETQYVGEAEARDKILEFLEKAAGPRENGKKAELDFVLDCCHLLIPRQYLSDQMLKTRKSLIRALSDIRGDLQHMRIMIDMRWHPDTPAETVTGVGDPQKASGDGS